MSEPNTSGFPFSGMEDNGDLDVAAIFGGDPASDINPFDLPAAQTEQPAAPQEQPESPAAPVVTSDPAPAPAAAPEPAAAPNPEPVAPPAPQVKTQKPAPAVEPVNPISAAIDKQETQAAQTAAKSLFEKLPVFAHKSVKEPIEDASMTFEELRIQKSEDFADLEEGKYVSWSVEYCGIRKEIKDPKGTTIISMKETIERSREFLDALKKSKDKSPDCLVKPKVVMKTKGTAAYRGTFRTVEEARASDKEICLIPSADGQFYEMRKQEQGEFIAPKSKVTGFQQVRAGFRPALPLIPLPLIQQVISFFRSFMLEDEEYEALALIYWDKVERRFFAHVPKQNVRKEHIEADLRDCPYDDDSRYIRYADIHSHNSMDPFFSPEDNRDERGTGLYFVIGHLERFFPELKARISCEGSFVEIDPAEVIDWPASTFPDEWSKNVVCEKKSVSRRLSQRILEVSMLP